MRCWVFMATLGCGSAPAPTVPEPVAPVVESVPSVAPPQGPSRGEVTEMLATQAFADLRSLGGGWTRVGSHLDERVIKPVCGGDVPRLGLALSRRELHAFDGHRMVVHDILGSVPSGAAAWRLWLVPSGQQRPVLRVRVSRVDKVTLRWRAEDEGPDWADGADWVNDGALGGLARVEQLDCRPRAR